MLFCPQIARGDLIAGPFLMVNAVEGKLTLAMAGRFDYRNRTPSFGKVPVQDCGRPSGLKMASIDGVRVKTQKAFLAPSDASFDSSSKKIWTEARQRDVGLRRQGFGV